MNNIPSKIFLQVDAGGETPENFNELAVTWATERIHPNDIEYSLAPAIPKEEIEEAANNRDVIAEIIMDCMNDLEIHKWWDYGDYEEIRGKEDVASNAADLIAALSLPSAAVEGEKKAMLDKLPCNNCQGCGCTVCGGSGFVKS